MFVCPTHTEIKQTEISEFWAKKVLLQGHARRWMAHAPKVLNFSEWFKNTFKGKVMEGVGSVVADFLV